VLVSMISTGTAPADPPPQTRAIGVMSVSYGEFMTIKRSPARDNVFDWSTDGCSWTPPPWNWEHRAPCEQHDFGYQLRQGPQARAHRGPPGLDRPALPDRDAEQLPPALVVSQLRRRRLHDVRGCAQFQQLARLTSAAEVDGARANRPPPRRGQIPQRQRCRDLAPNASVYAVTTNRSDAGDRSSSNRRQCQIHHPLGHEHEARHRRHGHSSAGTTVRTAISGHHEDCPRVRR
jgi:Prokaryotic phospholipase A2